VSNSDKYIALVRFYFVPVVWDATKDLRMCDGQGSLDGVPFVNSLAAYRAVLTPTSWLVAVVAPTTTHSPVPGGLSGKFVVC